MPRPADLLQVAIRHFALGPGLMPIGYKVASSIEELADEDGSFVGDVLLPSLIVTLYRRQNTKVIRSVLNQ